MPRMGTNPMKWSDDVEMGRAVRITATMMVYIPSLTGYRSNRIGRTV
jgi:hypothetical protein